MMVLRYVCRVDWVECHCLVLKLKVVSAVTEVVLSCNGTHVTMVTELISCKVEVKPCNHCLNCCCLRSFVSFLHVLIVLFRHRNFSFRVLSDVTVWLHVVYVQLHDSPGVTDLVTEVSYAGKVAGGCEATPLHIPPGGPTSPTRPSSLSSLPRDASHRLSVIRHNAGQISRAVAVVVRPGLC